MTGYTRLQPHLAAKSFYFETGSFVEHQGRPAVFQQWNGPFLTQTCDCENGAAPFDQCRQLMFHIGVFWRQFMQELGLHTTKKNIFRWYDQNKAFNCC
jgi:hypothetical protein